MNLYIGIYSSETMCRLQLLGRLQMRNKSKRQYFWSLFRSERLVLRNNHELGSIYGKKFLDRMKQKNNLNYLSISAVYPLILQVALALKTPQVTLALEMMMKFNELQTWSRWLNTLKHRLDAFYIVSFYILEKFPHCFWLCEISVSYFHLTYHGKS